MCMFMCMSMYMLPKQCLHWRVSGGFSLRAWLPGLARLGRRYARSFLLLYAILGACHLRTSQLKHSVATLSSIKHICFGSFSLQDDSEPWVPPGCLLVAFWVPLGLLHHDSSSMRCFLKIYMRFLKIYSKNVKCRKWVFGHVSQREMAKLGSHEVV